MEVKRLHYARAERRTKGTAVYGAKGFLFLPGITGRDPKTGIPVDGIENQVRVIWESIKERLEEFGTSLENICHIRMDIVGRPTGMMDAIQGFWKEHCPKFVVDKEPPCYTGVQVAALADPKLLVEFTVVAAIP